MWMVCRHRGKSVSLGRSQRNDRGREEMAKVGDLLPFRFSGIDEASKK